jgi:site-specific DNA recombinase
MKRAAIYARFSSELQNERSIEDQVALCRSDAQREGLHVVAVHEDRARSGGSLFGRDGVAALMHDASQRRFDIVIVEALDRLSRDVADLANIYKRLSFAEVELRAVHDGPVDEMLVTMRGLFGQYFRKGLKNKIRRGMAGRVRDGQIQAGLAYGYAAVPGKTGERVIVETEAAVVRRIFEAFVAGETPRRIARALNADGIPSPRGGKWNATTINGSSKRGVGILRNELYVGRFVWGRTSKVQSPDTGRDLIRPGVAGMRVAAERPALAIVPRDLFDRVSAHKEQNARKYRASVDDLGQHLGGGEAGPLSKPAEAVRSLIETVTVCRAEEPGSVRVRIRGNLAALLAETSCTDNERAGSGNRTRAFSLGS